MASPGNPNQPGGVPFDMQQQQQQHFFKPPPNPISPNPQPQQPTYAAQPPPSASYPPPSGPYSYPPQTTTQFHNNPPYQIPPYSHQDQQITNNLPHQRSVSYPTPPLQPPSPHHLNPQNPNAGARLMALLSAPASTLENPQQSALPLPPLQPSVSGSLEFSMPGLPSVSSAPTAIIPTLATTHSSPMRMASRKLPKGRHLIGDRVVYDIDVRLEGEVQPQLEVTPITKYNSDPGLVLGRQIAVNKTYICYGLKMGAVRVLNINTALRSLLKGLAQRVTDMAFFAEDVHLLASASVDGRVYVWKITEGADDEDKPQITEKIVIAIQIVGEGDSVHPRVCWHCHKQEVLVVGIGKRVLKIDTTKVGKGEVFSAEKPLRCPVDNLIDGVQNVGKHDGEVTDLSMCQWMTTRLVSASTDGTVKIWEDRRVQPLVVLRPYDGQPVNSVTFLTAPHRPDHIILITGGPLNREVKIWASASEEGWLLPSDAESWQCTQTLYLKTSAESRVEDVFFNQVVALSQAGLLLLANAKKNAIYAVHLEYGPNPSATRMDYIAEFTVTMPILSFTGTSDILPHGEHTVQVYCVQTQAIQQYALDISQCFPPPIENAMLEKSESSAFYDASSMDGFSSLDSAGGKPNEMLLSGSAPKLSTHDSEKAQMTRHLESSTSVDVTPPVEFVTSGLEVQPISLPTATSVNDISCVVSPTLPLSPRLSGRLSGLRSPTNGFEQGPGMDDCSRDQQVTEYSVDRQMDNVHANLSDIPPLDDNSKISEDKVAHDDISNVLNSPLTFKHPTHLITPSEILMATSSETSHAAEQKSEVESDIQDVAVNSDMHNDEVEVKVVGETGFSQNNDTGSHKESPNHIPESKEKAFYSQASDLGIEMARECSASASETHSVVEARQLEANNVGEALAPTLTSKGDNFDSNDTTGSNVATGLSSVNAQQTGPTPKGRKQKSKGAQVSGPSSPSPSAFNSTDSSGEPAVSLSIPSAEAAFTQLTAMHDALYQLTTMQKEMQKQMNVMISNPVTKEGRRLEAALGKSMEKAFKSNCDALWARFQEESAKQEKLVRERTQQMTTMITNCMNKDLPALVEKMLKKELAAVGPAIARTISPAVEKTVSVAITEAFQRGVGDKAVNQLEKSVNSKLEATVARQILAQFQNSGKQAIQDALKSGLEASIIPAFEMSCKAMFEQIDTTFQKGMIEHTTAAQQQFDSAHSSLGLALRDAINSASSLTQSLSGELADGQRKLVALAVAGANSNAVNPLVSQLSNGPLGGLHDKIEAPLDPTKELSRLISERKYEEAFTTALQRSDVSIVSWLCSQVDLQRILSVVPLPLSQGVLLSLLQQVACDISKDTARKLDWMRDVTVAINPSDPMIAVHVRPIFEQVYQILNHHRSLPTTPGSELTSIRLVMHVINSMLMTCK